MDSKILYTLYEIYGDNIEIEESLKNEERFESRTDLTVTWFSGLAGYLVGSPGQATWTA